MQSVFEEDMHAKRVLSLGNGVLGGMYAASLWVHAIGQGLAGAREIHGAKHSIKQVDRLLSNRKLDVLELFATWVPFMLGEREEAFIVLDWTDFDADDHAVIAAFLVTSHGRATPLAWKTVIKSELANARNEHEDGLLLRLHEIIPRDVRVTILADRGFGDQALYTFLQQIGWHYVIRLRGCIEVRDCGRGPYPRAGGPDPPRVRGSVALSDDAQATAAAKLVNRSPGSE
ncbi:MAG: transposase [Nannocystaceae bacterium]